MDKRLITGLVTGFTAFFALIAAGPWLAVLLVVLIILLAKEYTKILRNKGFLPSHKIIIVSGILFGCAAYFNKVELIPIVVTLSVFASFLCVLFKGKQPYIANVATTLLGCAYCGWFPLHLFFLRSVGTESYASCGFCYGLLYTIMAFICVLVTDTFCYFTGSKFGKHKLSPVISPNKTIEGAAGGAVMCMIFSMAIGFAVGLEWYHSVILGLLIAVFSQLGDLCESMIKRDAGVKDSGNVLPGHGGFLDRTDSYILAIPVVYYYTEFFIQNNIFDIIRGLF